MAIRLPRTIRMDVSDTLIFERAAEPGEWAVSGAFAFLDDAPDTLAGRRRQAFANGFLGVGTFGWSTLVSVASATTEQHDAVVEALAAHFVHAHGAPSLEVARPVAAAEVAFAAELCAEHPINTLLAVQRDFDSKGQVREAFRVIPGRREPLHAPVWEIVEGADEPAPSTDGGRGAGS